MDLLINGEQVTVDSSVQTVRDLLQFFDLQDKVAIVEVGGTIVQKESQASTKVTNGDKIEIVHFVGGG